jgi:MerR family transcriptional regulator, light-induced transcriptional regulator
VEEQLTPRQVADALQVSESSVKRWCDRGAIPTVRTVGGHRRIPLDGLLCFLEKTNRQVLLPNSLKSAEAESVSESEESAPIEKLLPQFENAVAEGDETTCRVLITKFYARSESFAIVADELIAAAFRDLGRQWDCGDLKVYQERRGCEICHRLLHEFRRIVPDSPPNAPLAIGGAPTGDNYTLPNQLIELVLRESNWRAMNLGNNLPLSTIAEAAVRYQPKMVWLSVSHLDDVAAFRASYSEFKRQLPPETHVVVGGRALNDQLRPSLNYTAHCDNMQQLAALAKAMHGRSKIQASDN